MYRRPADSRTVLHLFVRFVRIVSFAVLLLTPTVEAQDSRLEDRLKAAIISKFPSFTEWPASSLDGRATIDICLARPNRFETVLADLVAGESIGGRPLRVRQVESLRTLDTCHLLFIPSMAELQARELLTRARRLPVLTVGDSPTFLNDGGVVRLHLIKGRVRFDINIAAAQEAGLQLSSQLLRLAVNVRGGR